MQEEKIKAWEKYLDLSSQEVALQEQLEDLFEVIQGLPKGAKQHGTLSAFQETTKHTLFGVQKEKNRVEGSARGLSLTRNKNTMFYRSFNNNEMRRTTCTTKI